MTEQCPHLWQNIRTAEHYSKTSPLWQTSILVLGPHLQFLPFEFYLPYPTCHYRLPHPDIWLTFHSSTSATLASCNQPAVDVVRPHFSPFHHSFTLEKNTLTAFVLGSSSLLALLHLRARLFISRTSTQESGQDESSRCLAVCTSCHPTPNFALISAFLPGPYPLSPSFPSLFPRQQSPLLSVYLGPFC